MQSYFKILLSMACISASISAHAAIILTLEQPGMALRTSTTNTVVEDFNSLANNSIKKSYTNSFGTYSVTSGNINIQKASKWGGADGKGSYLFLPGGGEGVKLTFSAPVSYFGFWWSAGDDANRLEIQTRSNVLEFTTSDILNSPALTPLHFGNPFWKNPTSHKEYTANWQPFAFVNLFAESALDTITAIRFYGSNFESDNHTISTQPLQTTGARVSTLGVTAVSAPSTMALFSAALLLLATRQRKHKNLCILE
jgi:hypothetical protein